MPHRHRMKPPDKAALFRELTKLLQADFHLDRGLDLLLGQKPRTQVAAFLREVKTRLVAGRGLAEAMRQSGGQAVDALDLALIEAGEQSGRLAQSFALLADYYESVADSLRRARGALVYPLVLAHLAVIVPEIPAAIAAQELVSLPLRIVLRLGVLWAVLLGAAWWWQRLSARARLSPVADSWLALVPVLGGMREHWALARFTRVAHAAMLAAVRPAHWVRLAGEASGSGRMACGARSAAERVAEGNPVAASLRAGGGFPKRFVDALDTAEEAGTLDHELERWTRLEAEQARAATDRAAVWLPRVLYGVIVVYVAWRIIGMMVEVYAPLLRAADSF